MPKRLNLLYLIRTWDLGGSHTIIRLFLKHLPEERFNIVTVPYDAPGDGDQRFIESVHKQGGDVAPERIPWHSRGDWFRARAQVDELIAKYSIDVIHCHDTISNVLVGLGRKRFRCAAVASPYGWWTPKWHLEAQLNHWIENHLALPNFDRVYTVSETMKKNVLKGGTPEERIRVIHTGLDLSQFERGAQDREAVRTELAVPEDALVVGTVSRLFAEKGHTHLLDAAHALLPDFPQLHLLIVGTGGERQALEEKAARLGMADHVTFTGFYDDLTGALRAMDIFCQPSILHEGFPTAVLEAQAAGLPVVASDIGGTFETIDEGKTGLLCKPADAADLAAKLRQLLENPARRHEMAKAARPWIENSFTLRNMVEQIGNAYEEACARWRAQHGTTL